MTWTLTTPALTLRKKKKKIHLAVKKVLPKQNTTCTFFLQHIREK